MHFISLAVVVIATESTVMEVSGLIHTYRTTFLPNVSLRAKILYTVAFLLGFFPPFESTYICL